MERFLLIIREDLKRLQTMTPQERQANIPPMLKWVEYIASTGDYLGGQPLEARGCYVRKEGVISDGPFIESKEGVSGYCMITAEGLDQAVAIAQMCPLVTTGEAVVEVRPVLAVPPDLEPPSQY